MSEQLTTDKLHHIIGSLERIHKCEKKIIDSLNIYSIYNSKMINRYNNYDYSKFENSNVIFNNLKNYFELYEKNNKGKYGIIHGDPVFTNILINQFGKIKLIDMRGKICDICTIYGDTNYDWAKIYQSLIGYDEILENKYVSKDYKNKLVNQFEKYIIKNYNLEKLNDIKMITKLLLFTLIPLHNNEKCENYYKLINKIKVN